MSVNQRIWFNRPWNKQPDSWWAIFTLIISQAGPTDHGFSCSWYPIFNLCSVTTFICYFWPFGMEWSKILKQWFFWRVQNRIVAFHNIVKYYIPILVNMVKLQIFIKLDAIQFCLSSQSSLLKNWQFNSFPLYFLNLRI